MTDTYTLKSKDEMTFNVTEDVAKLMGTVNDLIEDGVVTKKGIPLPAVTGNILSKVVEYCAHRVANPPPVRGEDEGPETSDDITDWERAFCKVDQTTLFEMILAANYLDVKPLLDLTCKTVANMIKGKTPEEIRKIFNIKNDFSPEEEEQIRKENEWCEEK